MRLFTLKYYFFCGFFVSVFLIFFVVFFQVFVWFPVIIMYKPIIVSFSCAEQQGGLYREAAGRGLGRELGGGRLLIYYCTTFEWG